MADGGEGGGKPPISVNAEALRLYRLQRVRVKMDVEIERSIHKLLPSLSNEIRIATELLRLIHDTEEIPVAAAGDEFWEGLEQVDD